MTQSTQSLAPSAPYFLRVWDTLPDLIDQTLTTHSSFVAGILDTQYETEFPLLITYFQENPTAIHAYFKEAEAIDTKLFAFLDFLKSSFFSQNEKIPENIMSAFQEHSDTRDGIFRYVEYNNGQVMDLGHTEQDNTLEFHIFLLENMDFSIRRDIEMSEFIEIKEVLQNPISRIDEYFKSMSQSWDIIPPVSLTRDIHSFMILAETINKIALIHTASPEEFQISLEIGNLIRTKVNKLRDSLSESYIKEHALTKKLAFLSWKVQRNFAHLSPIVGSSCTQIEQKILSIRTELNEWHRLQKSSGFWWDQQAERVAEKIRDWNIAIAELSWIQKMEQIWEDIPTDIVDRKAKYLSILCDVYSFCAGVTLFDGVSIIEHFVTHDTKQSHDELEAIYHIIRFDTETSDASLLRLMRFFQWQLDKKSNKNFLYEELMIKIIAHIIRKLHLSTERMSYMDSIESIRTSLEGKNISHSILSYSRVYLALALCYIDSEDTQEHGQNAFIHYQNLTTRDPILNKDIILSPDEYHFYKTLGEKRAKSYYKENPLPSADILVELGKIVLSEYSNRRKIITDLAMERRISIMVTDMNIDTHVVYPQNHFNQELWQEIARDIFYHICNIVIIGDDQSPHMESFDQDTQIMEYLDETGVETSINTSSRRWFAQTTIDLNGETSIGFIYPISSEQIFEQIFSKNKESIKKYFLQLITTNNKNIHIERINTEYRRLAFYDPTTGLPNRNRLKEALETNLSVDKSIMLIQVAEYEALKSNPDGWENATALIKAIARSLWKYSYDGFGEWKSELYHINDDVFAIVSNESDKTIRKFTKHLRDVISRAENISAQLYVGVVVDAKEDAFEHASIALWKNRKGHGDSAYYFVPEDKEARIQKQEDTDMLMRSIDHRNTEYHIEPYYQGKFDIEGNLLWVEALARFVRIDDLGEKSIISPKSLLEIAIEIGRLPEVTKIMIAKMRKDLRRHPNLHMSFNLHNQDWLNTELWHALIEFGKEVSMRGEGGLTAEILETVELKSATDIEKMQRLREMGIHLAVDDLWSVGTHSTNVRVVDFPFDEIKIDQIVIEKLYDPDTFEAGKILILNYVDLARRRRIKKITAEYVKTQEIAELLIEWGVTQLQGYYFNEPMPLNDLVDRFQIKTP